MIDSATDGIKFESMNKHALRDTSFDHIRIVNPGTGGAGRAIAAGNAAL